MNGQNPATQKPVIVVGAGPAGCTAALLLAGYGIPVTLLERHTHPHPLPRAVHLDDEVARTLDRIGVSEGFLDRSRPGSGLRLLDAGHRVMAEFRRDHRASEGEPRVGSLDPIPQDQVVLGQPVSNGQDGRSHALVAGRQETHEQKQQQRGVQIVGLVMLAEHAPV